MMIHLHELRLDPVEGRRQLQPMYMQPPMTSVVSLRTKYKEELQLMLSHGTLVQPRTWTMLKMPMKRLEA